MASTSRAGGNFGVAAPSNEYNEFSVRVPKNTGKKYSIMKINSNEKIDISKWPQTKIERENNMREFKPDDEVIPTHGAGSEFGRERREEARKKKYGIITKSYKPEHQPWILKQSGKNGKRYKGKKEGGITDNSSYYIFMQGPDGAFEAFPLDSWYNFTPTITYKTLNAEEAEEEYGRRDKVMNYFSIMVKKRLKEEDDEEDGKVTLQQIKNIDGLQITEGDEYQGFMSEEDEDSDDEDGVEKKKKPKTKPKSKEKSTKKKKKKESDDEEEPLEESDEGDFDGREFDYLSEASSEGELETTKDDLKGLDQELSGDEDEESDVENEENKEGNEEEDANKKAEATKEKEVFQSSDSGSDSDDSDDLDKTELKSALFIQKSEKSQKKSSNRASPSASGSSSRSGTPTTLLDAAVTSSTLTAVASKLQHNKRKGIDDGPPSKRAKGSPAPASGTRTPVGDIGITEDMVMRYLKRKPMTTKDLLHKLRAKKTGMKRDEIVRTLTDIIRKLNPQKINHKDKTLWFIKS
ncbi:general transcription factor IIF subunit 1-like [Saccoglossus kowalevskii]|uniref:Transcription initiation factor IIF subunit alpha n=1 Tax=Saccoglossus kowalevskii TaxID=10224 RepID=A0ABM0GJI9_SACKO|nr:PREDICTED: general transcription factor IIF subunit 1-like [Saccoglossus kowalevskii]